MKDKERLQTIIKHFFDVSTTCSLEVSEQLGMDKIQINQLHYLKLIDENANLTFSRMAEILNIKKPSVTEIVNKLIKLGCVEKIQSPDDGRIFFIELTRKGENIARSRSLSENRLIELIQQKLDPDEIDDFVRLIEKISAP